MTEKKRTELTYLFKEISSSEANDNVCVNDAFTYHQVHMLLKRSSNFNCSTLYNLLPSIYIHI